MTISAQPPAPEAPVRAVTGGRFRHAPDKSVAGYARASAKACDPAFDWRIEPALAGYHRITHRAPEQDRDIPVPVCATPAMIPGAGVLIAGYDGWVRFFDPLLEKIYWRVRLPHPIYAPLLMDPDGDSVIVADTGGTIARLTLRGEALWRTALERPVFAAPELLAERRRVVLSCFGGDLTLLDLDTGAVTATVQLPRPWFADSAPRAALRDPYSSPVGISPGRVAVCAANTVSVHDDTGRAVWTHAAKAQIRASPAVAPRAGAVMIAGVDGRCSILDTQSGRLQGDVGLGDKVTASPAVSGDIAAVGSASGAVFGIDMARRRIAWRHPHGGPADHSGFSLLPDGAFIATNARGNIVARSADDGRFLWETSQLIGLTGHAPRIDTTPVCAPNGMMYAASYDGAVYAFLFKARGP